MDFVKNKTADVGCGRGDLGDQDNDFISNTKFDHGVGSEAQAWRRQSCDRDWAMRMSNGVCGE